jgi:DNA-binding Lrp family transcriptional regulator
LQIDGRVPFSKLGRVLGVSDQTVARRYRKLQSLFRMRVVGRLNPRALNQAEWYIRLQSTPETAERIALALAKRNDTSWVSLTSGGTEIVCVARGPDANSEQTALLSKLANTPRIVAISAHNMLHKFVGGPVVWEGMADELDAEQIAGIQAGLGDGRYDGAVRLTEADHLMMEVLASDGRAPYQQLAATTRSTENTVRRRLELLRASGILFFDIDIDYHLLGFHSPVLLWLSIRPSDLVAVAEEIAGHPEVSLAAATTGHANLVVASLCRDSDHLFEYLTSRIGTIDGIHSIETIPILKTLKRASSMFNPMP